LTCSPVSVTLAEGSQLLSFFNFMDGLAPVKFVHGYST
jgi:hypothetical protein